MGGLTWAESTCPQLATLSGKNLSLARGMGAANLKQSKPWKVLWFAPAWQDTIGAESRPALSPQPSALRPAAELGRLLPPLRLEG